MASSGSFLQFWISTGYQENGWLAWFYSSFIPTLSSPCSWQLWRKPQTYAFFIIRIMLFAWNWAVSMCWEWKTNIGSVMSFHDQNMIICYCFRHESAAHCHALNSEFSVCFIQHCVYRKGILLSIFGQGDVELLGVIFIFITAKCF